MTEASSMTTGTLHGVVGNLCTIEVSGPVGQNEICFITTASNEELMAEVIKIQGSIAYAQVFESTRGLRFGDSVRFAGHLLEVELGPGILSRNYDGLQNNLDTKTGIFLKRGEYTLALNREELWDFKPLAKQGQTVEAGDWLASVKELVIDHKIPVPFALAGFWSVLSIRNAGRYTVMDVIAVLENANGEQVEVTMLQRWPVKRPILCYREKPRPFKLLETGIRIIDTFNPMTEGGTGFIPGPFGCGKTVLQHALSKNAEADVILFAACGERANEVVEIFTEFPELVDPRTGRKLMERTCIICNTSNMPVASREASVYTAMTIAEYYRSMGLKVLLLADSTSRWAQALREMSNRLEELPGPDAFPMDLGAVIANFYARAGFVRLNSGASGSITFIGTVSPAGGNLREPVTENTKKVARCFYALAQSRADSKRYPAVDPVDSYSKYLEYPEVMDFFSKELGSDWVLTVNTLRDLVIRGRTAFEQINILGDDGVPLDYHVAFWKSEVVDFVLMQQDAFDPVDSKCPLQRQKYMVDLVRQVTQSNFQFKVFEEVAPWFKKLINAMKQINYTVFHSPEFDELEAAFRKLWAERKAV